jgi:hypothetical protein
MSNIVPVNPTSITIPDSDDPWAQYAASEGGNQLGKLIKYTKGHWFQGENEIAIGTEFLALIRDAAISDIRWDGGKPVETKHMDKMSELKDGPGFIRENARFAPRASLGHTDKTLWETDNKGEPRDPWQQQRLLPMLHLENGELFCWAFTSWGARKTFAELAASYSPHRNTNRLPVISLQTGFKKYDDYGRVDIPILKIERWDSFGDAPEIAATPPKPPKDDPISTGIVTKPKANADLDDTIPFAPEFR